MIVYINSIPAVFSHLTHIPLSIVGIAFFFLIVIGTAFLFATALKAVIPELIHQQIQFIYISWLFCSLWTYYHGYFGQREQLIFLFFMPFFVLRHARYIQAYIPLHLTIIITLIAFCGVAIKPYYILPILVIEAIHVLVHRCYTKPFTSVEIPLCVCLGILYMAHLFFIPGMSSFYNYWLEVTLRGYSAYDVGWKAVLITLLNVPFLFLYLILVFFLCLVIFHNKKSLFLLSSCCGWFACCSLALYFWQAKGWPYQTLPFYHSIFIGIALLVLALQRPITEKLSLYLPLLSVISFFVVAVCYPNPFFLMRAPFQVPPFSFPNTKIVQVIESLTEPDDSVLFLNTSITPGFPALTYTGRRHGGRFLCTFPLAFFFKNSSDYIPEKQWRDDEARFYELIEKDVHTLKPKLIFINTHDHLQGTAPYFRSNRTVPRASC